MPEPIPGPRTVGAILAGGLGTRMGWRDKVLMRLGGETLLRHIVRRLEPQCGGLILNANGDPSRFTDISLPVIPDILPGHAGPLAGLLSALDWALAHRPEAEWVVTVPGDTPFLPEDLVMRLHAARQDAGLPLACAESGDRLHPAVGLWPVALRDDLHHALTEENVRSVRGWAERHGYARAVWPETPTDPFFNINTPEDLAAAEALLLEPTHD